MKYLTPLLALLAAAPAFAADVALELRSEARIVGPDVTLGQVARWDSGDPDVPGDLASLPVATVGREKYLHLGPADIEDALRRAGVSPAVVELHGARRCLVERLDVNYDEQRALARWADGPKADVPAGPAGETLADLLIADLARRGGPGLNVSFDAEAEVLALPSGAFEMTLSPRRPNTLGRVQWDVTIRHDGREETQRVAAHVTRTVTTLVVRGPLAEGGPVDPALVEAVEVEIDREPRSPLATRDDLAGAELARDLRPGDTLTLRHLRPMPLVRRGQFVTVTVGNNGVSVKTVAKALEDGAKGQIVRVRDEATRSTYTALVTGPGTAALGSAVASNR